jgi:hypothetical protein
MQWLAPLLLPYPILKLMPPCGSRTNSAEDLRKPAQYQVLEFSASVFQIQTQKKLPRIRCLHGYSVMLRKSWDPLGRHISDADIWHLIIIALRVLRVTIFSVPR